MTVICWRVVLLDWVTGQDFISLAQRGKGYFYSCLNTLEISVPSVSVVAKSIQTEIQILVTYMAYCVPDVDGKPMQV